MERWERTRNSYSEKIEGTIGDVQTLRETKKAINIGSGDIPNSMRRSVYRT